MEAQHFLSIQRLGIPVQVGVHAYEKTEPQALYFSFKLQLSFGNAMETDDLRHTLDYEKIAEDLRQLLTGRTFNLLETVAKTVRDYWAQKTTIHTLWMRIEKPLALEAADSVAVEWEESFNGAHTP